MLLCPPNCIPCTFCLKQHRHLLILKALTPLYQVKSRDFQPSSTPPSLNLLCRLRLGLLYHSFPWDHMSLRMAWGEVWSYQPVFTPFSGFLPHPESASSPMCDFTGTGSSWGHTSCYLPLGFQLWEQPQPPSCSPLNLPAPPAVAFPSARSSSSCAAAEMHWSSMHV